MVKASLWVGLVLLAACGGKSQSPLLQPAAGGASPSAGSANGEAGSSVAGMAGTLVGRGGANNGAGGKVPDPTAGRAGDDPLACSTPYSGPIGGPRSVGPIDLRGCANLSDADILARYKDRSTRIPQGFYYEPNDSIEFWNPPCSASLDETVARGPTDGMGTLSASYSTEWFHEAVYCLNGVRRLERNLRCDYFDGETLAKPNPDRLAFLAGLLWWSRYHDLAGAAILGHTTFGGDTFDGVQLCTLFTIHGDFGLCDELHLETTDYRVGLNGKVVIGETETVRTLKGDCR